LLTLYRTLYRREVVEKLLQPLSMLEVLNQRIHRNACAGKDGRPAEDIRVAMKDLIPFYATTSQFRDVYEVRRTYYNG